MQLRLRLWQISQILDAEAERPWVDSLPNAYKPTPAYEGPVFGLGLVRMRQARWVVPQVLLTKVAFVSMVVLAKHSVAALGTEMISWPEREPTAASAIAEDTGTS